MMMTREQYQGVCNRYNGLLILKDDAEEALDFVRELLEAEAQAVRVKNPVATAKIDLLEDSANQLLAIREAIANEQFSDATKNGRRKN